MRKSRFGILKLLATLAMIASISGLFSLSASAAPGSATSGLRAPGQTTEPTLELCHSLDTDGDLNLTESELAGVPEADRDAVRSFCDDLPSMTVAPAETGTVTVTVYDCANLDSETAVWDGTPGEDCVASTAPVKIVFTSQGAGLETSVDITGSGTQTLRTGEYSAIENGTFASTTFTVEAGANTDLTLLRPVTPATDTFPVTITATTPDGGSAEGALVTIEEDLGGAQTFMAAQLAPVTGTIGADNTFTTALPAGNYLVTIDATGQGYGVMTVAFAVPAAGPIVVDLPAASTGFVNVFNYYCPGITDVVFNGDVDLSACDTGAGTFTFYLEGDGTADYWQVSVWEDGFGSIELPVGTYVVVNEANQAQTTITVAAGATTDLVVANPGEAPAPRDGTVNVSAFVCNNIDTVTWSSDSFMTAFALPTTEPACDPGTATLTFYLIGDGTADNWQVVADPTGSITLAPGDYEVVEEGTQARTFVTVYPGDFITLDVQIPAGGAVVPGSSVNIVKFYCDTVTSTEFLSLGAAEYSDRDEPAGAPDCVSGAATFTFYLVGDGTDDYAQIWVNGAGSIGLEPGIYEVVEEETQARYTFEVLDGENTVLVVNNPMPESGEVPGGPGETPAETPAETPSAGGASNVTTLPSTGSGHADSTSTYMLAAAAAALIAGAGAFVIRRDEAA